MERRQLKEPQENLLRFVNSIKRSIIAPQISEKRLGAIWLVDISFVEYESEYEKRQGILKMVSKGLIHLAGNYRKSDYYRYQRKKKRRSELYTLKKILRYYRLHRSIRKEGLRADYENPASLPWIFAADDFFIRLDGHHRASVARFLGYDRIPVLLITPKDILALPNLSRDVVNFMKALKEPEISSITQHVMGLPAGRI